MNNAKGMCTRISVWLIIKVVINWLIGGGLNFRDLVVAVLLAAGLITGKIPFFNYISAVIIGAVALYYLPGNISGLPGSFIYLIEAIVDVICVIILCTNKDVKDYFPKSF